VKNSPAAPTYQLKVTLAEVGPPVWRRIRVRGDLSLERLHAVVQRAMGWYDSHLHEWTVEGRRYGQPEADEPDYEVDDERKVTRAARSPVSFRRVSRRRARLSTGGLRRSSRLRGVPGGNPRSPASGAQGSVGVGGWEVRPGGVRLGGSEPQAEDAQVTKVAVGDWPSATLEQICDIQLGKMLSPKSRIGLRPRPYLRNANVLWNRFDLSSMLEMDFAEEEEEKFGLRDGDVLVCEGGEPGRAAVWVNQIAPCFYQKALLRLRPHDRVVDPYFMMFRLWLGATTGEFTSDHAKTTIAHLPEVRLRALRIGVPSMAVQKQIVRLLTDGMAQADRARAAAEEQISLASCLAQALISE